MSVVTLTKKEWIFHFTPIMGKEEDHPHNFKGKEIACENACEENRIWSLVNRQDVMQILVGNHHDALELYITQEIIDPGTEVVVNL